MSSTEAPTTSRPRPVSHARDFGRGFFGKLALVGLVDAFGVYLAMTAFAQGSMGIFWGMVVILVVVNWIYFSRRALPLKYLVPGLVFLLVYQIFTMGYTAYI